MNNREIPDVHGQLPSRMTPTEWDQFITDYGDSLKDISSELSNSFLMYGQFMKGKIIFQGKKYFVTGWNSPNMCYVDIKEEIG